MNRHLFCFGVGFCGLEVLKHAQASGFDVSGCVRYKQNAQEIFKQTNFNVHCLDDVSIKLFENVTHILMTIPPVSNDNSYYEQFAKFVNHAPNLRWFGYLSTTGVYGDKGGYMVNENTPVNPTGKRGKRRVESENYWNDICNKTHIFRLPAIYGAGRSVLDAVVKQGARGIKKSGQVFSRIHNFDIAQTVLASMNKPNYRAVYNVVDDMATSPIEPLQYACDLLGLDSVPVIDYEVAELSDMARSFYRDNKLVDNSLIKQELGVVLKYPTYKQGLDDILK